MEKYIKLKQNEQGFTDLEVRTKYWLNGFGEDYRRGYYLQVFPVTRSNNCIAYRSLLSHRDPVVFLKEVGRKSKKAEAEADNLAEEMEHELVEFVCKEYGLEVKD